MEGRDDDSEQVKGEQFLDECTVAWEDRVLVRPRSVACCSQIVARSSRPLVPGRGTLSVRQPAQQLRHLCRSQATAGTIEHTRQTLVLPSRSVGEKTRARDGLANRSRMVGPASPQST